jgi:hypothetical protein
MIFCRIVEKEDATVVLTTANQGKIGMAEHLLRCLRQSARKAVVNATGCLFNKCRSKPTAWQGL